MFFYFLYPLKDDCGAFNIFRYISFRSTMAAITAFLISVLIGPYLIRLLKRKGIIEKQCATGSEKLDEMRKSKPVVPTMGGGMILLAILVSALLWGRLDNRFIQLGILGTIAFGIIGFIDDYIKLVYPHRKGLRSAAKFSLQFAVSFSLALAVLVYFDRMGDPGLFRLYIPIGKELFISLGLFGGVGLFLFALLMIIGTSNAVNLTDGLDGLAAGLMLITTVAMAVVCYITGRNDFSEYLRIFHVQGSGELTIFCATMAGACMGFLWFNCNPAQVYMGDTGALSLGGLLGYIAVACKQELLLFIVGGVFYFEVLSVVMQVASCKLRNGKRIFLCSPVHHHFQYLNWSDSKIAVRFWIIGTILAIFGLSTLKMH